MAHSEFNALIDLLAMLVLDWRTGILMLLLTVAAIFDYRLQRIPNWLVLTGLAYGLAYNTALPPSPHDNILLPMEGIGIGLALFLPLYLVRAMGAGDAKLLAMVGSFLGAGETFRATLAIMIVGGALAILLVLVKGTALRMFHNLVFFFRVGLLNVASGSAPNLKIAEGASAGKLPYGVAIAIGTIGYLVLHQLGYF